MIRMLPTRNQARGISKLLIFLLAGLIIAWLSRDVVILRSFGEDQMEAFTRLYLPQSSLRVESNATDRVVENVEASTNITALVTQQSLPLPPKNLTLEERFSAYLPSLAPFSEFDRKRFSKLSLAQSNPLKVPAPILVASLPKSGTSSMWKYFLCGGHMAAHTNSRVNETAAVRIGDCIQSNIRAGIKPFSSCGPYYVWSDAGSVTRCFFPSIHALDALYEAYPSMTIVLIRRNATEWAHSMLKFHHLGSRLAACSANATNSTFMPRNDSVPELVQFYHEHRRRVQEFCRVHPSWTFVDLPLEGTRTGQKLEDVLGVSSTCWKNCNPSQRHCKDTGRKRR